MANTNGTRGLDLEPIGLMIGSLIRRSWIILIVTVLVATSTWFVFEATEDPIDGVTATSRVGVTTEVVWPFFDVTLEQGRVIAEDPTFRSDLESELGFPVISVTTDVPDMLSVFDIEIVAGTAEHAVAAADRAAQMVVERGIAAQSARVAADIASLDPQIAELETRIVELQARLEPLNAAMQDISRELDVEYTQARDEERYQLSLQRDAEQAALVDATRELNTRTTERATLQDASQPAAQFELLRRAQNPLDSSSPQLPLTIGAGFVALLLAASIVVVSGRRTGTLRHPWQLQGVCGSDRVDTLVAHNGLIRDVADLADRLHLEQSAGRPVIGVIDGTVRGVDPAVLAHGLTSQGLASTVSVEPIPAADGSLTLVDVTNEHLTADAPRVRTRRCDGVLLLVDRGTTVRRAADLIGRTTATPGLVSSVMVSER